MQCVQTAKGGGMEVLGKLFLSNEEFKGRVRRTHIADEIEAVRVCISTCFSTKYSERKEIPFFWVARQFYETYANLFRPPSAA